MAEPQQPDERPWRVDPVTGLPLTDPYPEYICCVHCGEPEVEVYCYQTAVVCHHCGNTLPHVPPAGCGTFPTCRRGRPAPDQAGCA
jgi:hypothetical protein